VIVLNMHYTGLGVARALRDTGAEVWGLSFDNNFIGNASRYSRFSLYPDPAQDSTATLAFLAEFRQRFEHPPLIVPTRDLDIDFLLKHRSEIESHYLLPFPPTPVLERILDKSRLFEAARGIGIVCPQEVRVSSS